MREIELLVPAGSLDTLKIAVIYGADAVYIGGEAFGLRAKAKNFTGEEMRAGIAFAHAHHVRVYVTANILAHNADLDGVEAYFRELADMQPDALIISDPGVFEIARRVLPDMDIHISTQANNTNYGTYRFWHRLGAKRVVSARELSLKEIREIRDHIPEEMEIESFVHGAMCISYSGRCLLSSFLAGRDANRGACTHPCRWNYAVVEETRPGEYLPVFENERGTFLFNSKDLCMIGYVPELIEAGIDSFKIEGRMKTALYAATVTRAYRRAIDDYRESPEKYRANLSWYHAEIAKCAVREFTTGFYLGKPGREAQVYQDGVSLKRCTYLGTVEEVRADGWFRLTQKNKFSVGERIEVMKPDGRNESLIVRGMTTEDGTPQESCPHASEVIFVDPGPSQRMEPYDILRRCEEPDADFERRTPGCWHL
ncbi:MAG: U32 family peptidase [Clostridiales bacterium]|nr:U32 family peptidase [Clostridiales bacterium]